MHGSTFLSGTCCHATVAFAQETQMFYDKFIPSQEKKSCYILSNYILMEKSLASSERIDFLGKGR